MVGPAGGDNCSLARHLFPLRGKLVQRTRNLRANAAVKTASDSLVWGASDDALVWGASGALVWGASGALVWGASDALVWGASDALVWGA